jgi:hypothetical protein
LQEIASKRDIVEIPETAIVTEVETRIRQQYRYPTSAKGGQIWATGRHLNGDTKRVAEDKQHDAVMGEVSSCQRTVGTVE